MAYINSIKERPSHRDTPGSVAYIKRTQFMYRATINKTVYPVHPFYIKVEHIHGIDM